jgi:hypothetical protein
MTHPSREQLTGSHGKNMIDRVMPALTLDQRGWPVGVAEAIEQCRDSGRPLGFIPLPPPTGIIHKHQCPRCARPWPHPLASCQATELMVCPRCRRARAQATVPPPPGLTVSESQLWKD